MKKSHSLLIYLSMTILMVLILFLPIRQEERHKIQLPQAKAATISLVDRRVATKTQESNPLIETETVEAEAEAVMREPEEVSLQATTEEELVTVQKEEVAATVEDEKPKPLLIDGYYSIEEATKAPIFDRTVLASRIQYPPMAKRQRKEGLVVLRLFISELGLIDKILIEQDPGYGFADAAVRAFDGLSVQPASRDGKPIRVTLTYPVRFALQ
ncbi:MAG: energy transducer TonB [Spirochaetia bacterium]|nr:energy transducer TonB [Spirochaetia bacterium]